MGPVFDRYRVPDGRIVDKIRIRAVYRSIRLDVTCWKDGFPMLRAVHEIKMTTWLMQNVKESPEIAKEYEKRMRTIRGQAADSEGWRPF